jgi:hypothetical protein
VLGLPATYRNFKTAFGEMKLRGEEHLPREKPQKATDK